jgi:energy-coupling factor transporter ATP-binding protein EcfA2
MNSADNSQIALDSILADFQTEHLAEFRASAIADDIIAHNLRSFEPSTNPNDTGSEYELDEIFGILIDNPEHINNGTLSGTAQQSAANALLDGGWVFEGDKGKTVKPNTPRKGKQKKVINDDLKLAIDQKFIKYESVRGKGKQQIFIPHVTVRAAANIALLLDFDDYKSSSSNDNDIDTNFWEYVAENNVPIIVTEGVKKALAILSSGFIAIGLNGVSGWSNGKDDDGNRLIHQELLPFLGVKRDWVLAFDIDTKPKTIANVNREKLAFRDRVGSKASKVDEIKWEGDFKGIDDRLASVPDRCAASEMKRLFRCRRAELVDDTKAAENHSDKTHDFDNEETKGGKKTAGDKLLDLAQIATYFHTADKIAYTDIHIDGNRHTYAVRSKAFKTWLSGEFYKSEGKGISSQTLQDTLNTLEAIALFGGETHEVHLRTAEHQGKIYLDLGTSDWKAVEIDSSGWRVIAEPPVRFWRPDSLLPLPIPITGGSLDELKDLLNVDGSSWFLIITFLLFCFCPDKPYPLLVLTAHRGSGKTAAAEIIKGLIDPGKAGLIKLQGDTHKLAVAASRRHLMVYDNVSHISPDESDNLCMVATGMGYSTRTLHTTDEETTFELKRPQIITAIDALVTRDDLADRVLMAQLPEITEDKRLPQGELNAKVEAARPRILGALLTALGQTLAQLPHTKPATLPRMADYALFAIASERALGLKKGEFMETFNESREQSRRIVIESSPVGEAIVRLMEATPLVWKGTMSELLKDLENHTDEATYRSRFFPKASNMLSRQLKRLTPDLQALGLEVRDGFRSNNKETRTIVIEKVVKVSATSATSATNSLQPIADGSFSSGGYSESYPPLTRHKPESIRHKSESTEELVDSGGYLSATDELSATYPPLAEPMSGKGLNSSVADVADVADKNTLFSKESNKVIALDNIQEVPEGEF